MKLAIEIGSTCAGDTVKGYIGEMNEQEISAITTSIATSNGTAVLDVTTLPTTTFTGEARAAHNDQGHTRIHGGNHRQGRLEYTCPNPNAVWDMVILR